MCMQVLSKWFLTKGGGTCSGAFVIDIIWYVLSSMRNILLCHVECEGTTLANEYICKCLIADCTGLNYR